MKQKFINIYVLVSAVLAISTTVLEVQPALFFIGFLAPNPGDTYNLVFVLLMSCLIFLIPLLFFLSRAWTGKAKQRAAEQLTNAMRSPFVGQIMSPARRLT